VGVGRGGGGRGGGRSPVYISRVFLTEGVGGRIPVYISRVFLTDWQARFLKSALFSRHIFAASTLAGDSVFGSASSDITDSRI
jgi:hypothetical protein